MKTIASVLEFHTSREVVNASLPNDRACAHRHNTYSKFHAGNSPGSWEPVSVR